MVAIGLSAYIIWRFVWYIKNYGDTSEAPPSVRPQDFKKTFLSNVSFLVIAALFALTGILYIGLD
ncbi:MAG: hypothetical protein PVF58_21835 [Candidatus Methanofastidiosia archaeon]